MKRIIIKPIKISTLPFFQIFLLTKCRKSGPSGRAVWAVRLRPLACWDCGYESLWGHERLSVVSVVCFQVEVYGTS
jgi:hypothetical protein